MKTYGVIAKNIDYIMEGLKEAEKGFDFNYNHVLTADNAAEVIEFLKDKDPDKYTIEEFVTDSDNEFVEGSEYVSGTDFIRNMEI